MLPTEFSFRSREKCLHRLEREEFDFLIIGGGITGGAVARDAASRGLKVALIEKNDFASGTSSASSKLIHGGLRYLEKFQLSLVFEALKERALLLKTAPHRVKALPFYFPVYQGVKPTRLLLSLGLWLYDLLSFFRSRHQSLSVKKFLKKIPFLNSEQLKGGFIYTDATMWDDVLVIENLRSAYARGAAIVSRVEAIDPIWIGSRMAGWRVKSETREFEIMAKRTIVCAGPWTDQVGMRIEKSWKPWLTPSQGVHLVFDWKKIPVPGAVVMAHPSDGRIAFVIPRTDFGQGITLVGTTDSPAPKDPEQSRVTQAEVDYLVGLLQNTFPTLKISHSDILSATVGIRPLVGAIPGSEGGKALQKVSREHHLEVGPGGAVFVAGGKYTTARQMAEEIVDFTLKEWKKAEKQGSAPLFPKNLGKSRTQIPLNPRALKKYSADRSESPQKLIDIFGGETQEILKLQAEIPDELKNFEDPEGFPCLAGTFLFWVRNGMVLKLEDFYLRRVPLFLTRKDHGLPWAKALAKILAWEKKETQVVDEEFLNTQVLELKNRFKRVEL